MMSARSNRLKKTLTTSLCLLVLALPMPSVTMLAPSANKEQQLRQAMDLFQQGQAEQAIVTLKNLTQAQPNFRLAHLLLGDMLASQAGRPLLQNWQNRSTEQLLQEARARWQNERPPADQIPTSLLALNQKQRHAIAVDVAKSRLYLIEQREGALSTIADFYVSIGKNGAGKKVEGDKRTPLGVYTIVEHLSGQDLPDKYGPMAFPMNYPNRWDQRANRTGNGIWLHGVTSQTYSRPPLDSDGCVAMINEDLKSIAPLIEVGQTPIVIGENLDWQAVSQQQATKDAILQALQQWKTDWESLDANAYLQHYATDFAARGMNLATWKKYKRRVNANKTFIKVALSDISIFQYPNESNLYEVHFNQAYQSSNFNNQSDKVLYLKQQNQQWRIVGETNRA